MSNVTLWARPAWNTDRWVRDFFGPAAADDWFKGFRPAAEIAKDGDDAVVRVELPGVDVERDVNVEVDKGQLVIHGERRDERIQEDPAKEVRYLSAGALRLVPPVVPAADACQWGRDLRVVRRRCADRTGGRCLQGRTGPAHRDRKQVVLATPKSGGAQGVPPDSWYSGLLQTRQYV